MNVGIYIVFRSCRISANIAVNAHQIWYHGNIGMKFNDLKYGSVLGPHWHFFIFIFHTLICNLVSDKLNFENWPIRS
jgi:hypothetical protein